MRLKIPVRGVAILLAALLLPPAYATTVLKMTLEDLASRADRVFRGSVLSIEPGTVSVGGGELPTVTYEVLVQERFKGDFPSTGDKTVVTITMVGTMKDAPVVVNGKRRLSALPDMPDLRVGGEYVLFTTAPSRIGLSTTVGLGQGAFKIYLSPEGNELAANELENAGLFNGPVTYNTLAHAIRGVLGN
jgi:hypothetical protein